MDARTRHTMHGIMSEFSGWVKTLAQESQHVDGPQSAHALEQRLRQEGQRMLGRLFEKLLQNALDHQPAARTCPRCGKRRRHRGVRPRGLISSVGAIRLSGPYWHCWDCGGQHALDALADDSVSGPMCELLCLLGTALASFAKASAASEKLLGVRVSDSFIRRLCHRRGRRVTVEPVPIEPTGCQHVVGSCDGTMVNTRQDGWRELKAYQFRHGSHKHGRAYLEPSGCFVPRLRKAAMALKVDRAEQVVWVADAADWIDKGVRIQLPMAVRIIDIWHARQHVHEAAMQIYPDDDAKARAWALRYCRDLEDYGGKAVWRRLRHATYRQAYRQAAVDTLRKYLKKNAARLDYPAFRKAGYPISSGPMESFCKQLGQRLKGPGMRWSKHNVTPMAALVSLWSNGEWDGHWQTVA